MKNSSEEIAEKQQKQNKSIEANFLNALDEHQIEIDGEKGFVYTQKNNQGQATEVIYMAFSEVGRNDPDAKVFMLFSSPENRLNPEETLNNVKNMGNDNMKKLYKLQQKIVEKIDSKGDPNKITIAERDERVRINGEVMHFFYIPKDSGINGFDTLEETKRIICTSRY